jgi:hypothetical protein
MSYDAVYVDSMMALFGRRIVEVPSVFTGARPGAVGLTQRVGTASVAGATMA